MIQENDLRLFIYNAAVVQNGLSDALKRRGSESAMASVASGNPELGPYISQFGEATRQAAADMAVWYVLFHMLENEIRRFISETLEEKAPGGWWESCVPDPVKVEVQNNKNRELDFGLVPRSDDELDYTTFGQLGDIIRANWDVFGGDVPLSFHPAATRVLGLVTPRSVG